VPGRRRQEDRSTATRRLLVATARRLFAERGYPDVPADEIVAAAGLTRGALRHHFGDKAGLFRAVFEQVEQETTARVVAGLGGGPDGGSGSGSAGWTALTRGLAAFLDACEEPEVIRIALTDAPAVLGWTTWRAIEAEYGLGLLTLALGQAMDDGVLTRHPVDVLARLLLSATIEAALVIAQAADRPAARAAVETALRGLLAGLRTDQPDPAGGISAAGAGRPPPGGAARSGGSAR
jgi:AcrR family transcriptional regulator